jgi:hypothetical protein
MELIETYAALGYSLVGVYGSTLKFIGTQPAQELITLVDAANGETLNSAECRALKSYLGANSSQWKAFKDLYNKPKKNAREIRYHNELDQVFFEAFEVGKGAVDLTISGVSYRLPTTTSMVAWEAAKNQIRAELPYDED